MILLAFFFFAALSAVFLQHLFPVWSTAIPGGLEDTRLFLWNAWWFRHAIHTLHTNPYFTRLLFWPFGTSLIAHDFPLWANLVTYTAQAAGMGVAATCNVWFMLSWILAGFCTYLLAAEVTRHRGAAIVAGLYVMTHSYTLARAMQNWGQFNLYAIALFLWTLIRARRTGRTQDFVLSGVALAWTAACHYYFLIYSTVIWLAVGFADVCPWRIGLENNAAPSRPARAAWSTVALLAGLAGAWIIFLHPGRLVVGHTVIGLESPANAMLVFWIALFGAWATRYKLRVKPHPVQRDASQYLILAVTTGICLSPLVFAAAKLALSGGYPKQSILWKTHLAGANLLSVFWPNPLNAWWGPNVSQWIVSRGMDPQEQAAGIGWVCLVIVLWSQVWRSLRVAARWLALALSATVLAMGVYLHILEFNTWMPLPFYVWRLLPVFGNVRVPERWMAVGAIAWGVVLALGIIALARRKGWSVNKVCLIAGALVLLENWPGLPLGTPPANQPVYEHLRQLPPGAVLPLPFYIGDSSIGAGNTPAGFIWDQLGVQIYHQHPILGGYVGRISRGLIKNYKADPFFNGLIAVEEQEDANVPPLSTSRACQSLQAFDVTYVLLYPQALTPRTQDYIRHSLPLVPLGQSDGTELYRVDCK